jgi:ABC-type uncharacterized transport system substrate-binding protein
VRRRAIIFGFVGMAVGAQRAAVALQNVMPVIGFLHPNSAESTRFVEAFRRGLAETGYHEGKNFTIQYRWGDGHFNRLASLALDLVRLPVGLIATPGSTAAALAAKTATTTIPIVFGIPEDAVRLGLVASVPRPGGNATGFNFQTVELVAKRLELFHELLPEAKRVAVLVNPTNANNAEDT